jgi:adenosine kinase
MGKPQLVICGSIAIDRIMNFSGRYRDLIKPDKLHALSLSTLLDKLEDSPGGIGANIAANIAVLGEKPLLVASVGKDAKAYVDNLAKLGVDTSQIHFSDLPTASFNVITDSEDSQVGGFFQGAMADSDSLTLEPFKESETVVMVAANNPEAMNRQVKQCQAQHLRMFYDPGQQVSDNRVDLSAGVDAAEVLFVNDYEMGLLHHRINTTPEEIKQQVPLVITTLGRDGSVIEGYEVPEPIKVGIAQPADIADPTGAGDAYRAGFLYGYLRQWELIKCGQLGATLASFIVERRGTQPWYSQQDVLERYKKNFKEEIEL